jgi:hypothetical protein
MRYMLRKSVKCNTVMHCDPLGKLLWGWCDSQKELNAIFEILEGYRNKRTKECGCEAEVVEVNE